jgi:hypothetical protein
MTDRIAIVGLVITALGSIAVPVGLTLVGQDDGRASAGGERAISAGGTSTPSVPATTSAGAIEPSTSTGAASGQLTGTTLELAEGYYADLDSGKVANEDLFKREADIGLRSLDLMAANNWESNSTARMALLEEGAGGPEACDSATRFTRYLSDRNMRVGTRLCVRTTKNRMFMLQIEEIPTYSMQPPVLVLEVASAPYDPAAAMFDRTLELAEGYYADLDSGKVDNQDLFKREADIGLRNLDLMAANNWESNSTARMALLGSGAAGPQACSGVTRFTKYLSDRDLRVGMQVCVRSTRGRMFLLRVETIPSYSTQPPVLVVHLA